MNVAGNATRDPELKYAKGSGKAACKFAVAETERVQTDDGWQDGATTFHNVVCFGKLAENVAESIGKGTRVIVQGEQQSSTYQGNDGQEKTWTEIVANEVGLSLLFKAVR